MATCTQHEIVQRHVNSNYANAVPACWLCCCLLLFFSCFPRILHFALAFVLFSIRFFCFFFCFDFVGFGFDFIVFATRSFDIPYSVSAGKSVNPLVWDASDRPNRRFYLIFAWILESKVRTLKLIYSMNVALRFRSEPRGVSATLLTGEMNSVWAKWDRVSCNMSCLCQGSSGALTCCLTESIRNFLGNPANHPMMIYEWTRYFA